MLIRHVTLWPWPLSHWPWTCAVDRMSCGKIFTKFERDPRLRYWRFTDFETTIFQRINGFLQLLCLRHARLHRTLTGKSALDSDWRVSDHRQLFYQYQLFSHHLSPAKINVKCYQEWITSTVQHVAHYVNQAVLFFNWRFLNCAFVAGRQTDR